MFNLRAEEGVRVPREAHAAGRARGLRMQETRAHHVGQHDRRGGVPHLHPDARRLRAKDDVVMERFLNLLEHEVCEHFPRDGKFLVWTIMVFFLVFENMNKVKAHLTVETYRFKYGPQHYNI